MFQYNVPEGGGTVGVANEIYRNRADAGSSYGGGQDGLSMLSKGLKAYMAKPAATGSAPIAAPASQASATGLSQAPTVMGGTPATANLGGGGFMQGAGNVMSNYIAPAAAMAALVKGGNKLNIGAGNQAKWYRRAISDSNEKKLEKMGQALKFWKWGG